MRTTPSVFKRLIVGAASALAIATVGGVSAQVAAPAPAQAAYNDLQIKNVGGLALQVCRSWTHSSSTSPSCGGPSGNAKWLGQGRTTSSYLGWADTDAIWVPANEGIYRADGGGYIVRCNRGSSFWLKLSPGLLDQHFELRRERC